MKHALLAFLTVLFTVCLGQAQIVVPSTTFPVPGDTLFTQRDNMPGDLDLGSSGGPQQWDFSDLQAPFTRQTVIREPGEGQADADFPQATYMANITELGGEAYFQNTDTEMRLLGVFGEDPIGFGLQVLLEYNPPAIEKRADLTYPAANSHNFEFSLPAAFEDLPDFVQDSIPISVDSVRLRFAIERTDEVDAWGSMTIPVGTFDVIREKRIIIRNIRFDAKLLPDAPWLDVTDIAGDIVPPPDTLTSYVFHSDVAKEPITLANVDGAGELLSVEYKANDMVLSVKDSRSIEAGVYGYPNPAVNYMRFDFFGLQRGIYTLRILNVLGQELWRNTYFLNGDITERVDLSGFRKGTYLYSLQDARGKTLLTRRFIILRP
jgi:hypothetical protein